MQIWLTPFPSVYVMHHCKWLQRYTVAEVLTRVAGVDHFQILCGSGHLQLGFPHKICSLDSQGISKWISEMVGPG